MRVACATLGMFERKRWSEALRVMTTTVTVHCNRGGTNTSQSSMILDSRDVEPIAALCSGDQFNEIRRAQTNGFVGQRRFLECTPARVDPARTQPCDHC